MCGSSVNGAGADPGRALGAHVGEGLGVALHADGQRVAADAGHRHRAFGHLGRGVVRAAGAEVGRRAPCPTSLRTCRPLAALQALPGAASIARAAGRRGRSAGDQRRGDLAGRELAVDLQQLLAVALVGLADDAGRTSAGASCNSCVLQLLLDDRPLLLDHQDLALALGEGASRPRSPAARPSPPCRRRAPALGRRASSMPSSSSAWRTSR